MNELLSKYDHVLTSPYGHTTDLTSYVHHNDDSEDKPTSQESDVNSNLEEETIEKGSSSPSTEDASAFGDTFGRHHNPVQGGLKKNMLSPTRFYEDSYSSNESTANYSSLDDRKSSGIAKKSIGTSPSTISLVNFGPFNLMFLWKERASLKQLYFSLLLLSYAISFFSLFCMYLFFPESTRSNRPIDEWGETTKSCKHYHYLLFNTFWC